MKRLAIFFIVSLILSSCSGVRKSSKSTSSAQAAYPVNAAHEVVAAKLVKQKKVKVKYSKPKGYARSNRRGRIRG